MAFFNQSMKIFKSSREIVEFTYSKDLHIIIDMKNWNISASYVQIFKNLNILIILKLFMKQINSKKK